MQLTEAFDVVTWPDTHYIFVEKKGPFAQNAPQAWQDLHQILPAIAEHNQITGYLSRYKVGTQVYRAGVSVIAEPTNLPPGVKYKRFAGGKFRRFVLTGPYSQLPQASGRAFEVVAKEQTPLRDDYNIENYVKDPRITPEDQLITEILFPISS